MDLTLDFPNASLPMYIEYAVVSLVFISIPHAFIDSLQLFHPCTTSYLQAISSLHGTYTYILYMIFIIKHRQIARLQGIRKMTTIRRRAGQCMRRIIKSLSGLFRRIRIASSFSMSSSPLVPPLSSSQRKTTEKRQTQERKQRHSEHKTCT